MALIIRCQIALFSAYRADQYSDPEGFKNSLGAVLEGFPDEVICYVCDPRTGLQRRMKWPPTISEVIEACEDHRDHLERQRKPRTEPQRLVEETFDRPQGYLAGVFVPDGHPRYQQMVKWAETAPHKKWWKFGKSSEGKNGIWIPFGVWMGNDIANLRRAV